MIRLAVRCQPDLAEAVLAELLVLAPGGVEEDHGGDLVEYAIYGAPGELPDLGGLEAAAGDGLVEVCSEEVPDDWADRWRDFHEPAVIAGGRIVVRPPWLPAGDPGLEAGEATGLDVVIEPGQAFGTGAHPTTRMCLELLLALAGPGNERRSLADLGTGSGVLAIAAAMLGFTPVIACDHERAALDAARSNAATNGVRLDCRRLDVRADPLPRADVFVANLTAPLLLALAGRLDERKGPRELICSGLLERQVAEVAGAYAAAGLPVEESLAAGGWAALRLRAA